MVVAEFVAGSTQNRVNWGSPASGSPMIRGLNHHDAVSPTSILALVINVVSSVLHLVKSAVARMRQ